MSDQSHPHIAALKLYFGGRRDGIRREGIHKNLGTEPWQV